MTFGFHTRCCECSLVTACGVVPGIPVGRQVGQALMMSLCRRMGTAAAAAAAACDDDPGPTLTHAYMLSEF